MAKVEVALLWGLSSRPPQASLEPLSPPSEQRGLIACLGSRGTHSGSSHRLCSMTTTTPTPSTACARCCENSWNHPREGYSTLPSLPRKFGERDNGLFICPCRHAPDLTLSHKLTTREPWGWICRMQIVGYSFASQKRVLAKL